MRRVIWSFLGQVRALDKAGNDQAAGILLTQSVILLGCVGFWYPVVTCLHRYSTAVARLAPGGLLSTPVFGLLVLFLRRRRLGWGLGTMPFCLVLSPFGKKI